MYTPIASGDKAIRGLVKSHMHFKGYIDFIYILNTGGALQSTYGYHHAIALCIAICKGFCGPLFVSCYYNPGASYRGLFRIGSAF